MAGASGSIISRCQPLSSDASRLGAYCGHENRTSSRRPKIHQCTRGKQMGFPIPSIRYDWLSNHISEWKLWHRCRKLSAKEFGRFFRSQFRDVCRTCFRCNSACPGSRRQNREIESQRGRVRRAGKKLAANQHCLCGRKVRRNSVGFLAAF